MAPGRGATALLAGVYITSLVAKRAALIYSNKLIPPTYRYPVSRPGRKSNGVEYRGPTTTPTASECEVKREGTGARVGVEEKQDDGERREGTMEGEAEAGGSRLKAGRPSRTSHPANSAASGGSFIAEDPKTTRSTNERLKNSPDIEETTSTITSNASTTPKVQPSLSNTSSEAFSQTNDSPQLKSEEDPTLIPTSLPIPTREHPLRTSPVPSSRLARMMRYGSLSLSLSSSLIGSSISSTFSRSPTTETSPNNETQDSDSNDHQKKPTTNRTGRTLTPQQASLLVSHLSQMRGAALKLGQFLSLQDYESWDEGKTEGGGESSGNGDVRKELKEIWDKVMDGAEGMPGWQAEQVLKSSLGPDYRRHFLDLDLDHPSFSASLGQVHRCLLAPESPFASTSNSNSTSASSPSSSPLSPSNLRPSSSDFTTWHPPPNTPLALKLQFPGVSTSLNSDISSLSFLLRLFSGVLPKGLFMDKTLEVMKRELREECDYSREGRAVRRVGRMIEIDNEGGKFGLGMLRGRFRVPRVVEGLDGGKKGDVLAMEWMSGRALGRGGEGWENDQGERDKVATDLLRLSLMEVFCWRFMQTDPNWGNFLWDPKARQIQLVDFGATRSYSKKFTDGYLQLILAAVRDDRDACIEWSRKIGYLTGEESEEMIQAHLTSLQSLSIPFRNKPDFHFTTQTTRPISAHIRSQIPIMLNNRLTPPPEETYSLNRKLAGMFLLCARVGGRVRAGEVLEEVVERRAWWEERISQELGEWTA